jgi:hypothetical protein
MNAARNTEHMFGITRSSSSVAPAIREGRGSRALRPPDQGPAGISVFDAKVETLAYDDDSLTLEIAFRSGQCGQLSEVPRNVFDALEDSTITSFLNFMACR